MTMEMNVDIPASHRLTLEVPREVPEGKAKVVFTPLSDTNTDDWKPGSVKFSPHRPRLTHEEALERLWARGANSKSSVDKLLEERREDLEHEEAKYRRLFHKE
jgi:hypothetical protein